jgi:hypothetical protein
MNEGRCDERLKARVEESTSLTYTGLLNTGPKCSYSLLTGPKCSYSLLPKELLLFIIRVKRELKRVDRNGCRYNERLNAETIFFLLQKHVKKKIEDKLMWNLREFSGSAKKFWNVHPKIVK